jgi:hypothetical protein
MRARAGFLPSKDFVTQLKKVSQQCQNWARAAQQKEDAASLPKDAGPELEGVRSLALALKKRHRQAVARAHGQQYLRFDLVAGEQAQPVALGDGCQDELGF